MNRSLAWKIIPCILIIISLLAGVFIYKQGIKKEQKPQEVVTNSLIPIENTTILPTPSALEEVDLSKYKIQVLNGSGITGVAAKTKLELEKAGFIVISTGNADKNSYKYTIIKVKKNLPEEYTNKLREFLSKSRSLSDTDELITSGETDVVIIIGSTKK